MSFSSQIPNPWKDQKSVVLVAKGNLLFACPHKITPSHIMTCLYLLIRHCKWSFLSTVFVFGLYTFLRRIPGAKAKFGEYFVFAEQFVFLVYINHGN